jgi:hypothetical protein
LSKAFSHRLQITCKRCFQHYWCVGPEHNNTHFSSSFCLFTGFSEVEIEAKNQHELLRSIQYKKQKAYVENEAHAET